MKPIWLAFHLFMVLVYFTVGGILLFTALMPQVTGIGRIILGSVFLLYGCYRGFTVFRTYRKGLP